MEYKVTLEKCREHMGEQLYGVLNPWNSPLMKQKLGLLAFMTGTVALILLLNRLYWQPLVLIAAAGIWVVLPGKSNIKLQYKKELAEKIRYLVQDHQLAWLNFEYAENSDFKKLKKGHLESAPQRSLTGLDFRIFAYLKKEEGSQGIYRFFPEWKNSNSSNKHLDRMAEKGLVEKGGNDYKYVPWTFSIVSDGSFINIPSEENRKKEEMLAQAFDEFIDSYYLPERKMTPWERVRWKFGEGKRKGRG